MPFRLGMLALVIGAALVAGGCLKKDVVSTWYVEEDRRVVCFEWTWSIEADTKVDEDLIDDDLTALFEASTIRVALAEARFVSSSRGNLSEDRRIATCPVADLLEDHGKKTGEETTFVLRWSSR